VTVFVDTSAIYAIVDGDDEMHEVAAQTLRFLVNGERLVTHNYVILEAIALTQRRLGLDAVRDLNDRLVPLIDIRWIDPEEHRAAAEAMLAAGRKRVSLVDWASFTLMRRQRVDVAFTFDRDFAIQGFELIPPQAPPDPAISR
jgi:predicted nucleic acid-binding protein